jgi:prepilin-type N-terminal cleavage/methylation domain-containing protein
MMKTNTTRGFTIVELLTVMAVIAVLIGLLIPALAQVRDKAKEVQQKAQFHSIDVGLELYKSEYGAYPESVDNNFDPNPPAWYDLDTPYCGANKLAEAMVGLDMLGFHPKSGFTAEGTNDLDKDGTGNIIYDPINGIQSETTYNEADGPENIDNRDGFYVDLENANAFQMEDIYEATAPFTVPDVLVLGDVYAKRRFSGTKTGMPVLYYRARQAYTFQDSTDADDITDDVYNFKDNENLLSLGSPEDASIAHPLFDVTDDWLDFEDIIVNQTVFETTDDGSGTVGIKKPYREDSYFLLSAGKDGLYGTADDILNFDKEISE